MGNTLEKVRQRCSHITQRFNVLKRTSRLFTRCALLDGHFEYSATILTAPPQGRHHTVLCINRVFQQTASQLNRERRPLIVYRRGQIGIPKMLTCDFRVPIIS